jgi:ABC-2 type transport system permease protein
VSLLLHILKYKLITFLKTTFDVRAVSIVRGVGSLIVFGGFAAGAYVFSSWITSFVLDHTRIGMYLFHRFISMMLFVFFLTVNLGNIVVSYATLYRSSEVEYLLTKPVPYTTIFVLKFLDNFLYSSTTLFLVAFMVLWGYGSYFGYAWYWHLGVLLFVLIPFMFLSACLAVLILMAIMKFASRWGFRRVIAGLGGLYFLFAILFFRYSNPVRLVERVNRYYPNVDQYMMSLDPGFLVYLPNHWVSEFLFYMARGEWMHALPFLGILLGVTAAAFVVCLLVANRFYFKSWVVRFQFREVGARPRTRSTPWFVDFRRESLLPSPIAMLLRKDFFQFFREPSQWIHLTVMVVLVSLFVMSLRNIDVTLRVSEIQTLTYLVLYGFCGFLCSSLALRFIFPMVSLEGKPFWALLTSPIDRRTIYLTKFVVAFLFILVFAEVVAIASNLPFLHITEQRPLLMYFGIYSAFWLSFAMAALNLGFGSYFANYTEKNPIRLSSSQGATLTFLISLLFLIVLVSIIILPLTQYFKSLFEFQLFDMKTIVVPGVLLYAVSAVVGTVSLLLGMRSLRRDF